MEGIVNAKIVSTQLGFDKDRDFFTFWLQLEFSFVQGFGGFVLGGEYTDMFIKKILKCAGVNYWEELKGSYIRIDTTPRGINAIGHIIEDIWFYPKNVKKEIKKVVVENDYEQYSPHPLNHLDER